MLASLTDVPVDGSKHGKSSTNYTNFNSCSFIFIFFEEVSVAAVSPTVQSTGRIFFYCMKSKDNLHYCLPISASLLNNI